MLNTWYLLFVFCLERNNVITRRIWMIAGAIGAGAYIGRMYKRYVNTIQQNRRDEIAYVMSEYWKTVTPDNIKALQAELATIDTNAKKPTFREMMEAVWVKSA